MIDGIYCLEQNESLNNTDYFVTGRLSCN